MGRDLHDERCFAAARAIAGKGCSPGYSLTSASSCGARTRWRRARTVTTRSTIVCRRSHPTFQELRLHADRQFLQRLHTIERDELDAGERISYDLFEFMVSQRVTLARYQRMADAAQ